MDYEKKYKEALERAKGLLEGMKEGNYNALENDIIDIFPELKESEYERMKFLIKSCVYAADITPEGREEIFAWLEKQGEHKPYGQRKECEDCQSNYAGECKGFCQMKRDEQKPIDKVESKFHEGEWIIHQGTENIYQVVACIDNQYQLKYGDNYTVQKCTDVDRCTRLWTIADAKDGDVLVAKDDRPFIFTGEFDVQDDNPTAYCGINSDDKFITGKGSHWTFKDGIKPATKEQQDLLFAKMKEAGYEWDSEKNELKKVEQGNHPRIVMADFTGGEGFYKLNLDNLNEEQVFAIEIMINNPKPGKKIDADKVIAWLVVNICDFEYYVKRFKKDFGL